MSEDSPEQTEPERPAPEPPAPRPAKSGRGLAGLALLLALAALGLAAWPVWQAYQGEDEIGRLRTELESGFEARLEAAIEDSDRELRETLERRLGRLVEGQDALRGEIEGRLERIERQQGRTVGQIESRLAALADQEQELEETVGGLRRAFSELAGDVATAAPPDSREWRIAEAGYLMRIANQRARLEGDLAGAQALLQAADRVLAELDDYGLLPVREALRAAVTELEERPRVDRMGLYLELETLGRRVDSLPLESPEFRHEPAAAQPDEGWRGAVQRRLGALLDFRVRREEPIRPLLTPDDTFWLHHNLRLKLNQAQLALLRGEQTIWRESLAAAAGMVRQHLDAAPAEALAADLDGLAERTVAVSVPDISTPLRRLEALRSRAERPPEEPEQ